MDLYFLPLYMCEAFKKLCTSSLFCHTWYLCSVNTVPSIDFTAIFFLSMLKPHLCKFHDCRMHLSPKLTSVFILGQLCRDQTGGLWRFKFWELEGELDIRGCRLQHPQDLTCVQWRWLAMKYFYNIDTLLLFEWQTYNPVIGGPSD